MTDVKHFLATDYSAASYLLNFEQGYSNVHKFNLFDSEALLGWNNGDDWIQVLCPASFQKGKKTGAYGSFSYNRKYNYWSGEPPKGAAKVCAYEIKSITERERD